MLITFALLLAHIPCDCNKSTKTIIEPKRISEIAIRKKMRSSMGDKPKDAIPREEKRMQELNLLDPRTNIHRNVTRERLSEFFYSLSLSSPSAVLFKSIEGMSIATSMNLSLTNIANEVVVNHKNFSSDEKITLLLRKLFYGKGNPKHWEKYPGDSQILMLGKSIARDDWLHQNFKSSIQTGALVFPRAPVCLGSVYHYYIFQHDICPF